MNDIAIKVQNLSKAYRIGTQAEKADTLVGSAMNLIKAPLRNFRRLKSLNTFNTKEESDDILWALRDVSFEIKRGEVVGFIGRNGAGKSTLLKILSRITEPTTGEIEIRGRVSSLLEVGTGFHPELSGRENVYMNGTILGMKKAEIDGKFDEIVDFSGVERFLDTPVKRYSSGMKVRLAFAVAAHLEPEILIVDEVLAVGDAEFQKKCLGKMQDVASGGRTVLFVSHNMGAVQNLCVRAYALRNGLMVDEGVSREVIQRYLSSLCLNKNDAFSMDNPDRKGSGELRLTDAYLVNKHGDRIETIIAGEPVSFYFDYTAVRDLDDLLLTFTVYDEFGVAVTSINTGLNGFIVHSSGRSGTITCIIPRIPFAVGNYRVAVAIHSKKEKLDHIPGAIMFTVCDSIFFSTSKIPQRGYCTVYVDHEWQMKKNTEDVKNLFAQEVA
ncbi:ABC transporter ATP-binding protein [Desulfonatronum thioautotrophicum]|uniref:ABC transporter ATP-binding protein n=1 Tax=Desulfonatronum thioautotrophicum TaxID=617001 RepID=UPI0005EBE526|nr:ABC transporter ATP-binding protein [Desulfonatronum thioautotrophicum]